MDTPSLRFNVAWLNPKAVYFPIADMSMAVNRLEQDEPLSPVTANRGVLEYDGPIDGLNYSCSETGGFLSLSLILSRAFDNYGVAVEYPVLVEGPLQHDIRVLVEKELRQDPVVGSLKD